MRWQTRWPLQPLQPLQKNTVHQWIRSAIRDSQQQISPIGFLFLKFRHRLVRYYWYQFKKNIGMGSRQSLSKVRNSSCLTKYFPKLLPKSTSQSNCPKLPPKSCSLKASSKDTPYIVVSHSCSRKLFPKLFPKVVPETCSPKLVPEAAPELPSKATKLLPKCSRKQLPKAAPESYY